MFFLMKLLKRNKNSLGEEKQHSPKDFVIQNNILIKYRGKLSDVTIPEGVIEIEASAFEENKRIRSVIIPEGVTHIGPEAFDECRNLVHVTIPQSVTNIEEEAFEGCVNLTSLTIPQSVKYIGKEAFKDFTRTQTILFEGSEDQTKSFGQGWNRGCRATITFNNTTELQ